MRRPCTARRRCRAPLADLREAEARIEKIRVEQSAKAEALRAIQERFYAAGGEVTRIEQSIRARPRDAAASARRPGTGARLRSASSRAVIERDRSQLAGAGAGARHGAARPRCRARERARRALRARALRAGAHALAAGLRRSTRRRSPRVSARRRSSAPASSSWRISSTGSCSSASGRNGARGARAARAGLGARDARGAGGSGARCRPEGRRRSCAASARSSPRPASRSASRPRRSRRCARAGSSRSGLKVSTEALQQAALGKASGKITEWLEVAVARSESARRAAAAGGAWLGARGRDGARRLSRGRLRRRPRFGRGSARRLRRRPSRGGERAAATAAAAADPASLKAKVLGRAVPGLGARPGVHRGNACPRRCGCGAASASGQSVVTRDGVWLGADWLRLSRDPEPHTGVIEREETLRALRAEVSRLEAEVKNGESRARAQPRAGARVRGSARAAAGRGEPPAPRARRSARGARFGPGAQSRCRAAA